MPKGKWGFQKGNKLGKKFKSGHPTSNTGRTHFKKGETAGVKNPTWKGEEASYSAKHKWLKFNYGKADYCENRKEPFLSFKCSKKSKNYQWAKVHGKQHDHKRENYRKLCISCHKKYDLSIKIQ